MFAFYHETGARFIERIISYSSASPIVSALSVMEVDALYGSPIACSNLVFVAASVQALCGKAQREFGRNKASCMKVHAAPHALIDFVRSGGVLRRLAMPGEQRDKTRARPVLGDIGPVFSMKG